MQHLSPLKLQKSTIALSPKTSITQLWAGNIQLINALELVNWEDDALQFQICERCGIVGCASQGWVELKRSHNLALITPAFTRLEDAPANLRDEYLPPSYLYSGAIVLEDYAQLPDRFPKFETLPLLQSWEAVKLFQLEAPHQILGDFRDQPKFDRDLILVSSEGSFIEQTDELLTLLDRLQNNTQPVQLRKVAEGDHIISFYLDVAGIPQWKALSYDNLRYSLYLEPGYVVNLNP